MRVLTALLLLCAAVTAKVTSDNIYWEGEDDASNEFLEVDSGITSHLQRFKRQESYDPSQITENYESVTADYDDTHDNENEFDGGSGFPGRVESETKEKTILVSFVVNEPYQTNYSNRDSEEFQNFSKSLAAAVNAVFQNLPGTHRASLVRIQSRPVDGFTCKVNMEIVTMGTVETDVIVETLRNHIIKKRKLGAVAVDDVDFSFFVIDPDRDQEQVQDQDQDQDPDQERNQYQYQYQGQGQDQGHDQDENQDGDKDKDQDDDQDDDQEEDLEENQDQDQTSLNEFPREDTTNNNNGNNINFSDSRHLDNENDHSPEVATSDPLDVGPSEEDHPEGESDLNSQNVGTPPPSCPGTDLNCDGIRCISRKSWCDGISDCDDGTDEANCKNDQVRM